MKTKQYWSQGQSADHQAPETRMTALLHQRQHRLIIWAGISSVVLVVSTILWLI